MKTTTEDLCIYFLCFMLGYVFCQNMTGTEGMLKSDAKKKVDAILKKHTNAPDLNKILI